LVASVPHWQLLSLLKDLVPSWAEGLSRPFVKRGRLPLSLQMIVFDSLLPLSTGNFHFKFGGLLIRGLLLVAGRTALLFLLVLFLLFVLLVFLVLLILLILLTLVFLITLILSSVTIAGEALVEPRVLTLIAVNGAPLDSLEHLVHFSLAITA